MKTRLLFLYISYLGMISFGFQSFTVVPDDSNVQTALLPAHEETLANNTNDVDDNHDTPESEEAGEAESEKKSFWKRYKKEILCGIALCAAGVTFCYRVPLKNILNGKVTKEEKPAAGINKSSSLVDKDNTFRITDIKQGSIAVACPKAREYDAVYNGNIVLHYYAGPTEWGGANLGRFRFPSAQSGTTITVKHINELLNDLGHVSSTITSVPDHIIVSQGFNGEIKVDPHVHSIKHITNLVDPSESIAIQKVFVMNTEEAAEKYNELAEQGHKVFILLHTKCPEKKG